jgi:hypothetical protein
MNTRLLKDSDLYEIDQIWQRFYKGEFGLPSLDKAIYAVVVEDKEKVVGFGQTRLTTESLMIIDQSLTLREKVEILKLIMEAQTIGMTKAGHNESHAFAQNPNFARILKKHFGYEPVLGETLVMRINNG